MLHWMDGFEQYGTLETHMLEGVGGGAAWSDVSSSWALSSVNPATGSYHMRLTNSGDGAEIVRRAFGTDSQVSALGYRFTASDLPTTEGDALVMADFRDVSNGAHNMTIMGTDGSVIAIRGGAMGGVGVGGTVIDRSDPCIAAGGYHHFEVKTKIDNSVGYIEVRINEVTVLNLTGIDTQNTANAASAQIAFGRSGDSWSESSASTYDVDDCFTWDDDASDAENTVVDWVGDKGCYFLRPNADTATSDFDLNGSATAYGALDEVPPNGTDYLDTAATTARTIVGVQSLPGNVSEVIAMMPVIYARKEESGTVNLRGGVVMGTDESYTPTNSPSTEYAYMEPGPKTIDPESGVAWANDAEPELLIERLA